MEPVPEVYAVVTRGYMRKSGKVITHTYGPYTEATAKKIRRSMKRNARAIGAHFEASICRLIDPEGESDVVVSPPSVDGAALQGLGEGGGIPVRGNSGEGDASGPGAPSVLERIQRYPGAGPAE